MSGQSNQFPTAVHTRLDPIGCVGVLLLVFALFAGVRSIFDTLTANVRATPTPFLLVIESVVAQLPTVSPTPPPVTPSPTPLAVVGATEAVPTATAIRIRVTATPSPGPTNTATATPVPTETATPFSPFFPSPTPDHGQLEQDILLLLSPTPLAQPTPIGPDNGIGIPILMYHYTSEPPEGANRYRVDLSVSPTNLRRQLEYLQGHGYTTIDFNDLARGLANRQTLPEKPVILTFDDGYRDNYENAFPLLQAFGMKGVFFIVTEAVDFNDPNYMSWGMVREMAQAGMSMEIHTVSHPNLADLPYDKAREQILVAQQKISAETGVTPRFLSYPGGDYDEETLQIVRELDLWGAVTTQYGTFHQRANRYEWKRVRMRYTTSLSEFAALLRVYVPEE